MVAAAEGAERSWRCGQQPGQCPLGGSELSVKGNRSGAAWAQTGSARALVGLQEGQSGDERSLAGPVWASCPFIWSVNQDVRHMGRARDIGSLLVV